MTRFPAKTANPVTLTEIIREITYPLMHAAVLMTMVFLWVMLSFAIYGGILGLFLLFLILPALFRYLMVLLSWRARGLETPTLEVDHLYWFGNAWSIFPALIAVLLAFGLYAVNTRYGIQWAAVLAIVAIAVMPASLAVLVVTRSPIQSLNPRDVAAVIGRCGGAYWITPTFIVLAIMIIAWLLREDVVAAVRNFVALYLLFATFALIGGVIRKENLMLEAGIPDPILPDEAEVQIELDKQRRNVLGHAYGFISRGNRAGGFKHIEGWLRQDPDPRSGWEWFFQQMLRWENKDPALLFGQSYLSQLLKDGDRVSAVKVMMRCRLENERFVPLSDDMESAIEAAEDCGDQELATFLRSRV